MTRTGTLRDLFEQAIRAERTAEYIYDQFTIFFAAQPVVVAFWKHYAAEENSHALWLERLRDELTPEALTAPVAAEMLANIRALNQTPASILLARVEDLEDAFGLAHDLESSEVNTVFEFLTTSFASNERTPQFLHAQLNEHVERLISGFPEVFNSTYARRHVPAVRPAAT